MHKKRIPLDSELILELEENSTEIRQGENVTDILSFKYVRKKLRVWYSTKNSNLGELASGLVVMKYVLPVVSIILLKHLKHLLVLLWRKQLTNGERCNGFEF